MSARPHVTVHFAQSLDGRIALDGRETSLSTPEGRCSAHAARAAHDAVLVGSSTVRIDDPALTVRDAPGTSPLRVVLASTLALPRSARVLGRGTLVIAAEGRARAEERAWIESCGAEVAIVRASPEGLVAVDAALEALSARGVRRLLVEGGARVLTSFFRARAVDDVSVEIAMTFLGAPAISALGALGVVALPDAPTLANVSIERVGGNVLLRGDVVHA